MNIQLVRHLFRRLLPMLLTLALVACQGQQPAQLPVTQPPVTQPPVTGPVATGSRVVITPGALLLTAAGQKRQLSATLLDAQGSPVQTTFKWSSSAPELVRVGPDGSLETLGPVGSAQITAEAGGVRASALVVVAQPVAGAVLVTDAQIVGRPELLGDAPPALGSRYQVTLSGVDPPAVGAALLGSESTPLAGRVVSASRGASGVLVQLEAVPLGSLFDTFEVSVITDFGGTPVTGAALGVSGGPAPSAVLAQPDGSVLLRYKIEPGLHAQGEFKLGPLDCKNSGALQLSGSTFDVKVDQTLKGEFDAKLGKDHLLDLLRAKVDGGLKLTVSGGVTLNLALAGSVKCETVLGRKIIPVNGILAFFIAPSIPFGAGFEAAASLNLAGVSLRLEGSAESTVTAGFEYTRAGGFTDLTKPVENKWEAAPKWNIPSSSDLILNASVDLYATAGLDVSLGLGAANFGVLAAKAGLRQELSLSFPTFQAADPERASGYALKLRGEIGPGEGLGKLFEWLEGGPKKFNPGLSSETLLSSSPAGTFTVNKARVQPGETAEFAIDLDAATLNYLPGLYNVEQVRIYRQSDRDPVLKVFKTLPATPGQRSFTASWTPGPDDLGTYTFYAFVDSKLVPLVPLEVDKNTRRELVVGTAAKAWSGTVSYTIAGSSTTTQATPPPQPPTQGANSTTTTLTAGGGGSYTLVPGQQEGTLKIGSGTGTYTSGRKEEYSSVSYETARSGYCTYTGTSITQDEASGTADGLAGDNAGLFFPLTVGAGPDGKSYVLTLYTLGGQASGTSKFSGKGEVSGPPGECRPPSSSSDSRPITAAFPRQAFQIERPLDAANPGLLEGSQVYEDASSTPPLKYEIRWKLTLQ